MAIEESAPSPERNRLQLLIAHCQKRMNRADEKARAAIFEQTAAHIALEEAQLNLARWMEANPDPQGDLLLLVRRGA
ncbi:hypothetical protein [Sphingobium sp. ZW T5_29]|uniref:hypothetical protein n=1 Tax=Sphingobium sp. ZW T5_29 TaxID=3378077 RepID=UPI00385221E8